MNSHSYRAAGVDLETYRESMSRLPALLGRTQTPRVIPWKNGFAGMFQLDFAGGPFQRSYRQPVLVSGSDGVGTKIKVALLAGKHDTVGIDLVAMSVNDTICCGAEPLFFLDYVAMSRDDPAKLEQIVRGVSDGCLQASCALLGGETAIMPDMYQGDDYDLAGFCVGVVEFDERLDGSAIRIGDVVLGIGSTGLHSNGFSLVRRVVFGHANLTVDQYVPELERTVGEELLTPTAIYSALTSKVLRENRSAVHGIAHITGGGLAENLERILPDNLEARLEAGSWPQLAVFPWLQQLGSIAADEMARVFNRGIGLVLVVDPNHANSILAQVAEGWSCSVIGHVTNGSGKVVES